MRTHISQFNVATYKEPTYVIKQIGVIINRMELRLLQLDVAKGLVDHNDLTIVDEKGKEVTFEKDGRLSAGVYGWGMDDHIAFGLFSMKNCGGSVDLSQHDGYEQIGRFNHQEQEDVPYTECVSPDPGECQPCPDMSEVIDDEKGLIDNPEMDDWDRDRLEYDTTQKHVENLRSTLITCESVGEISTGEVNMWVDVELKVTLNSEVPLPDDEDLDMDRFRPKGFTVFRVKGDHCIILWDRAEIEYEMMVNRFKATMPDLDPLDFVYFE